MTGFTRTIIHAKGRVYVGDLKTYRTIMITGKDLIVSIWVIKFRSLVRTKFTVVDQNQ